MQMAGQYSHLGRLWQLKTGIAVLSMLGMLVSCAPQSPAKVADRQIAPAAESVAPKVMRMGMLIEPSSGLALFGGSSGMQEYPVTFHAGLTFYDGNGVGQPQLATKIPRIEDGDWQLFPDGRMEVTWKLRPGLRWHDGAPLTADDFVFGMQVVHDAQLPLERELTAKLITEVVAPDAETVVVRWKELYAEGNVSPVATIPAVPRHLIGELYQTGDKQAFANSSYWNREFVGVGPYRLGEWVAGSHIEARAFDQYYLGRPKIDRILFRFVGDLNTALANVLAGDLDMIPRSLEIEQALTIKRVWEPTGGGAVLASPRKLRFMELQYRDANAPWVRDVRVRRALLHGLDRQGMVDTLQGGLTRPADTYVPLEDPAFRLAEQRGLSKYAYDLNRSERLMAEAGWTLGPDRLLRNAAGERLSLEIRTSAGDEQEVAVLSDQWKSAGVDATPFSFPSSLKSDRQYRASFPGASLGERSITPTFLEGFGSAQIPTEANRWSGSNRGGFSNPALDRLYGQYSTTIEVSGRQSLLADMLKLVSEDVALLPLYYAVDSIVVRKGVRGPMAISSMTESPAWNIHAWEID
jgi:peptide/nickel transport system substrate-binding protein